MSSSNIEKPATRFALLNEVSAKCNIHEWIPLQEREKSIRAHPSHPCVPCAMVVWIPRYARNDTAFVMLNEVKHPCTGFLTGARNDKKGMLGITSVSHAERSAFSFSCHVERSETSILDSSLWLGMTQRVRGKHLCFAV